MYSGSDSTESQNFPQWALNPSTYQNMANDQVDWAALAQQWIIMKEAGPPPIPGEMPVVLNTKPKKEKSPEGGEAPMDVENEKEETPAWPGPPQVSSSEWNWNNQNQNWGWNNAWTPPNAVPPPPGVMKPPLLPTPNNFNQFSAPPESTSDNAVPFGGSGQNNDYSPVYWTNNKVIKPRNRRYSKVNVPTPIVPIAPTISEPPAVTPTLDAAKRKQLPAWIREGLEKMERDKLKQQEKEREKHERDIYNEKMKQTEKEKLEILKTTMKEQQKSKFESEGEYSEEEDSQSKMPALKPLPIPLTQEELMLKVRRTMTEVLLKVTNSQIESICKEEYQRYIKKLKASDHRTSAPSGANLSEKLGLGIYGEGSGSSSDDSEDEYHREKRDSDTELKDIIRKKVSDFTRTEREIEEKLAEAESRRGGNASRDSSPDSIDNDSQVDARLQGRRNRSLDKTPPQARSTRDAKPRTSSSSSDNSDSYLNSRSKTSRRSSSSDSLDSHKRTKKKYSRSRSRTPSKKYKGYDKYSFSVKSNSSRRSKSKSPSRKRRSRSDSRDRRNTNGSRKQYTRSRSPSYSSRSRRSRSSSYKRSKRSYSREKSRRSSRSNSRSRYAKSRRSRSRSSKRRRSRSLSSGRGKRSHRY